MVYLKSLLRIHYTLIMGRLIIYYEHINLIIIMIFVLNFCHLVILLFFLKPLFQFLTQP